MGNSSEGFNDTQEAAMRLLAGSGMENDPVAIEVVKTGKYNEEDIDIGDFLASRQKDLEKEPAQSAHNLTPEDRKLSDASDVWQRGEGTK